MKLDETVSALTVSLVELYDIKQGSPAIVFMKDIFGRQSHTTFRVETESGPGSSQNILSTAWCCCQLIVHQSQRHCHACYSWTGGQDAAKDS